MSWKFWDSARWKGVLGYLQVVGYTVWMIVTPIELLPRGLWGPYMALSMFAVPAVVIGYAVATDDVDRLVGLRDRLAVLGAMTGR